ncbi:MAG: helix-turn-helix domain-containing protein [Ignavibacteria bacterium]|nr:helix-turn-helix domain-containing protein [Ignavibacteria bacterium]
MTLQSSEFFHQVPVDDVTEGSQPSGEVRLIKGGIPDKQSCNIFDITRTTGYKLVNNEILYCSKTDCHIVKDDTDSTSNGF